MRVFLSRTMKRVWSVVLTGAVAFSMSNVNLALAAETEAATITVTPFAGQECYYGQTKTFLRDEQYSLSPEPSEETEISWELQPESYEIGEHKFTLVGDTEGFTLAQDAPTYQIKNLAISENADEIPAVNWAYMTDESLDTVSVAAPEGYLISNSNSLTAEWSDTLEVDKTTLQEGDNVLTYYLRSNQDNTTRKAIDINPKTITITKDSILPEISALSVDAVSDVSAEGSLSSTELGTYYYIVVSENYFAGKDDDGTESVLTADEIRKKVESNEGIVGYGRIDQSTPVVLSIQNLKPEISYVLYALLVDKAGNESDIKTVSFSTDKTALVGSASISGEVAVDQTLTASADLTTVDPGELTYQWYRIKLDSDQEDLNEIYDETGGADADDLEAVDDGDEDEEDDADDTSDEEESDDEIDTASIRKMAEDGSDEDLSIDDGILIEGATSATYKITKEDIGYRLGVSVSTSNASGEVTGFTSTFVPKLMPTYTLPQIASSVYSPTRTLSSIKLPSQWTWVDSTVVPVRGNSGYRAMFVPSDTSVYKTVVVRVKVPIAKKSLKKSMVTAPKKALYAAKAIKNNFTVKDGKTKLTSKKDFTVTYRNNKKVGTASVRLQGKGNYKGTVNFTFKIVKKSIKKVTCIYDEVKTYNGKKRTPNLVLKNGSVKMKAGTDYSVTYTNNKKIGQATVKIQGQGNYKGKKTLHFTIRPAQPTIKKTAANTGGFRVTMSKGNNTKGYYVFVSTSKSFTSTKTQQYTTTSDSLGIKGLAKGTYYVRLQAYAIRDSKVYKSVYSKTKKIVVKK